MPVLARLALFAQEESQPGGVANAIAWTIAILLIIGFVVAVLINMRRGRKEVGAEVELAANRGNMPTDEELETRKLDRTLGAGLILLAVIGVTLPLYWLAEPGRQANAVDNFQEIAISRGQVVYEEKAQCANCHGPDGGGGAAQTAILDESGNFVAQVTWKAPALNTVLYRYSKDEVLYILNYGRPPSPMAAWGAPGGGPLTEQQLTNTIAYLESIQLPASEVRAAVDKEIEDTCAPDGEGVCTLEGGQYRTLGEALFNMGYYTDFAGGAFSCGRCHTKGWSYGRAEEPGGGGGLGWNLTNGSTLRQFPAFQSQVDFVSQGSQQGKGYGRGGMGSGQMPGFGLNPTAEGDEETTLVPDQVMYTPEQVEAVVEYERGL
ncbi:MAG: cytochrome c [Acidimicrobiales bacterium]|jgi:mono/diheme cytochrome c family protein|nr:cytochrome c [Acidimicrobiales bacterium]